jgi:4-hydroxyphenylpyruvate dioxygenase
MSGLTISTNAIPGTLPDKFDLISAAGFSGVEINETELTTFNNSIQGLANKILKCDLTVSAVQLRLDIEGLKGKERAAAFSRLDHKLKLVKALSAQTLIIGTSTRHDADPSFDAMITDFSAMAEMAADAGCRIALLALPWATNVKTERDALKIVEAIDKPHFGLALNSFSTMIDGGQAAQLRDIPGAYIFYVQLSDAPRFGMDLQLARSNFGLLPGQGELNLPSFVRILSRSGYQGPWSISRVSGIAEGDSQMHILDNYRSLVNLLDEVANTEPTLARPLPDLPPRIYPTGIEFIEFAVDHKSRKRLTDLLRGMAFRKERQHVSKSVELWRQGAINIVVNSEKEGFAAEALREHGPCVCDMGIRVEDASQTVLRATQLGSPAFSQPVGSGELDIPAIKGAGGSVIHFIDEKSDLHRVWDIEFDPVTKTKECPPAGLRRVDHVSQTMRYQEMQSWLTYYTSTFQLEKTPIIDVLDPSGVTLSQALSSPDGEIRLNLNGAREQQTFAGAFLADGFGAGVQHIAFQTDDIFETSALLRDSQFIRLDMSDHYYDDLKVFFGLTSDFVASLRQNNILYDRDGKAEYFQIYSLPLFNGFFFEIIQRKGGYQGYGARNAPMRLAAQLQASKQKE